MQLSARGGLFLCSSPCGAPWCLALDRPRYQPGIFLFWWKSLAGRRTFLEKGSPSPYPSLPKTFTGEPAQGWKVCGAAGMTEPWARPWHCKAGSCGYRAQRVGEWGLCPEADSAGNRPPGCGNFSGSFFSLGDPCCPVFQDFLKSLWTSGQEQGTLPSARYY